MTTQHDARAEPSDNALMQALTRGEEQAFDCLLERHLDSVLRYLRRLCDSAADAEELSQETFMRLWTEAPAYDPNKARLTTWLHRIAHNLAIDRLRRSSKEAASIDATNIEAADLGAASSPTSTARGESDSAINDQRLRWLHSALNHLPSQQSAALALVFLQGFSNKEAATIMGIHLRALESLLARGKRALQQSAGDPAP